MTQNRHSSPRNQERTCVLHGHRPTRADLAYLFGCTERWIGTLRARGVLRVGDDLPQNVKRMAAYSAAAKQAKRRHKAVPHG